MDSMRDDLRPARTVMWLYVVTAVAIFLLMLLLGLVMRGEQAQWIVFGPGLFYSLMTLHGIGMITAFTIAGMGVMWYLVRRDGPLDARVAYVCYVSIVLGVVAVLVAVLFGRFAAAWTFLYPLPFVGATWPSWATGSFLLGVALVNLGWLIWCVQILGASWSRYGGLAGALGVDYIFRRRSFDAAGKHPPEPQAIAATVVSFDGVITGAAGMVIGTALIAHWLNPSIVLDPLWAKNVTYFFGHSIANLTIYMVIAGVYVALPAYTRREYHTSPVFVVAWWGTLLFVLIAYFHHLYMDFVQLRALQYIGEAASYLAAVPVAVVTVYGSAILVYRSGMRWSLGSLLMFAGLVGWLVGGVGALLDATVPFNSDLHNTLWVPAHFHTYLLEGVALFVFGWIFFMLEERSGRVTSSVMRWLVGLTFFGGGAVFLLGLYAAGAAGVPRRFAIEPMPGPHIAAWSTIGALVLALGTLLIIVEALRLALARRRPEATES